MLYIVITAVLFLWSTVQDIKHKSIHNGVFAAGAVSVALLLLLDARCEGELADFLLSQSIPWRNLWGVLPGVGVLLLSFGTRKSIGVGDGWLLCISGAALGLEMNLSLLCYALIFAGGTSAVLLVLKKVRRDTRLPFVPFLFGGYLLTLVQLRQM